MSKSPAKKAPARSKAAAGKAAPRKPAAKPKAPAKPAKAADTLSPSSCSLAQGRHADVILTSARYCCMPSLEPVTEPRRRASPSLGRALVMLRRPVERLVCARRCF